MHFLLKVALAYIKKDDFAEIFEICLACFGRCFEWQSEDNQINTCFLATRILDTLLFSGKLSPASPLRIFGIALLLTLIHHLLALRVLITCTPHTDCLVDERYTLTPLSFPHINLAY